MTTNFNPLGARVNDAEIGTEAPPANVAID